MMRVEVKPKLLRWARERAGFDLGALAHRFPQLAAWEHTISERHRASIWLVGEHPVYWTTRADT